MKERGRKNHATSHADLLGHCPLVLCMNGHSGPVKTVTVSSCHSKRCHCNRPLLWLQTWEVSDRRACNTSCRYAAKEEKSFILFCVLFDSFVLIPRPQAGRGILVYYSLLGLSRYCSWIGLAKNLRNVLLNNLASLPNQYRHHFGIRNAAAYA